MAEDESLDGTIGRVLYEDAGTGFVIAMLERPGKLPIAVKGTMPGVRAGERLRVLGGWREDPRYGRQFQVRSYLPVQPETLDALERHLGSALVDGIGPVFAKRLVEHFGDELMSVLDNDPGRLREVPGIGATRAARIAESWSDDRARRDSLVFLQGLGLKPGVAQRIHRRYGARTVEQLREDPWRLATDIRGVGFPTADAVAQHLGAAGDSPQRLRAGLRYALEQGALSGHCGLPREELIEQARRLLARPEPELEEALDQLLSGGSVVADRGLVWTFETHDDEEAAAERLIQLRAAKTRDLGLEAGPAIAWAEERSGLELTEAQREALSLALVNKVVVVTGGPGTGKTTLVRALIDLWERADLAVRLAAPTGRAARRMEEASGRRAGTLHRLLEYTPAEDRFVRDREQPLAGDAFVVDEASMIDLPLLRALLDGLPDAARLVLVGDVQQLPSVGPGQVLADVIDSGALPVVTLDVVFRQAQRSDIVRAAHGLLRGLPPRGAQSAEGDFFVIPRAQPEVALRTLVSVVAERIPKRWGLDPVRDVQVLSPMRKGPAGTEVLNELLREALNPAPPGAIAARFRAGDRVIQTRNNYDKDVFNGDVGVVLGPGGEGRGVLVRLMEGREVDYGKDELDQIELAWAITVHKSQGSEYPAVVVPLLGVHRRMLRRNLVYTALTRGKQVVVLVADPAALEGAAALGDARRRHTRLGARLRGG